MGAITERDEELGVVRVRAFVGHAEEGLGVQGTGQVLVSECAAVDRFPACAVEFRKICTGCGDDKLKMVTTGTYRLLGS